MSESRPMTIQKTAKRTASGTVEGSGVVLFGANPNSVGSRWVEKWFASEVKARAYAAKKGWAVS